MKQSLHLLPLIKCGEERRDSFNVAVGARIRRRRVLAGLQLKHVAVDAELPYNMISRIERGWSGASLKTLVKLARALQCTTDELLGLTPEKTVEVTP